MVNLKQLVPYRVRLYARTAWADLSRDALTPPDKLIRVVGRSDRPGRPLLFGTTRRFLDHFGLASVKDLPKVEDLKAP